MITQEEFSAPIQEYMQKFWGGGVVTVQYRNKVSKVAGASDSLVLIEIDPTDKGMFFRMFPMKMEVLPSKFNEELCEDLMASFRAIELLKATETKHNFAITSHTIRR